MQKPIVDKNLLLGKFPGKGGWTYTYVPAIEQEKKNGLGWIKVKGFIDDHEIKKYNLMPSKDGKLFLPLSATVRKAINKQAGDQVHVVLFIDNDPVEIPSEFMDCLRDEPGAMRSFKDLTETDKKNYIDWIYEAKREVTRINRIAKAIEKLINGKRFYDK